MISRLPPRLTTRNVLIFRSFSCFFPSGMVNGAFHRAWHGRHRHVGRRGSDLHLLRRVGHVLQESRVNFLEEFSRPRVHPPPGRCGYKSSVVNSATRPPIVRIEGVVEPLHHFAHQPLLPWCRGGRAGTRRSRRIIAYRETRLTRATDREDQHRADHTASQGSAHCVHIHRRTPRLSGPGPVVFKGTGKNTARLTSRTSSQGQAKFEIQN